MAEKFSIYAGEPMAAVLAGYDEQRSGRINQVCADYIDLVRDAMPTLTRAEWCAVMDATNGLFIMPGEASGRRFIWAEIADFEGLGEKWGIDQVALYSRVREMSQAQLVALCEASRTFWMFPERDTNEALKLSGVRISDAA